jgi:hypothetical protein
MQGWFVQLFFFLPLVFYAQLPVARDTITVIENGYVLKMPWAGGLNYVNASSCDLDFDGVKDLVMFDKMNQYGTGRFRCFISKGQGKYSHRADLSYSFPASSYWATLEDYNADGKPDLFASTSSGIKVYRNTSSSANGVSFSLARPLLYSNFTPTGTPSYGNLYASSAGKPAISDVNGDGKPDVLTFSPFGTFIEFHKNVGPPDSLHFQLEDNCWGKISESGCNVSLNSCGSASRIANGQGEPENRKPYHAGSCMTCLDNDGDMDQDLLMGDIECNVIQYVHNTGSASAALLTDTTKLYPNFPQKNNGTSQIRMNNFPCAFNVDVDDDGRKDLIAAPNAFGSENYRSVWYYRNTTTSGPAFFQLVKKNFLQDEMIEVGQNSYPALIDYDNDGKKDLLIGTYGYYENVSLMASLTLYRNTGSISQPVYSLVTRDYGGLSVKSLSHIMPAVGDVDGDGDTDILIGTSTGQVHWMENTAGAGNPCDFSIFKSNPFSFTTPSAEAAPQLFDLDNDTKPDLVIGMKNGRLAWYKNTSSGSSVTFSLQSNFLGSVEVKGAVTQYGLDGYAAPYLYREGNILRVLVGSVTGNIFLFEAGSDITQPFTLLSNQVNGFNEGEQSAPFYEDINNDGKRDLFVGNASGGVIFFSSASPYLSVTDYQDERLAIFPNPVVDILNVNVPERTSIRFFDLNGREKLFAELSPESSRVDLTSLTAGFYIAELRSVSGNISLRKLIKE